MPLVEFPFLAAIRTYIRRIQKQSKDTKSLLVSNAKLLLAHVISLIFILLTLARVGGGLQYLVGLCVCLLPQNCCLSSIISKSEHATALNLCKELAILLFYKADKFLKVELAQTTRKFKNCKNFMYRDEMKRLYNETNASTDASQYIRKIICEDLWRNVRV